MAKRLLIPAGLLRADTQAFFDVLNSEPDFSIVVVSTSYVDACLGALLQSFILESRVSDKLLDSRFGALGSFSARSDAAYVMGLIPKTIYQDLQQLAEIRNQFAHHHLSLNFSMPAVEEACFKLKYLGTIKNGDIDELAFPPDRMPPARERFKFTVIVINNYLLQAIETMKRLEENV